MRTGPPRPPSHRAAPSRLRRGLLIASPALMSGLVVAAEPFAADPRPEALVRLLPSVVGVEVFAPGAASAGEARPVSAGTGLVVSAEGWVLTAAGVVAPPGDILVRSADGGRLAARRLGVNRRTDLAVLKIAPGLPPVVLDIAPPEDSAPGEAVWTVGREDIGAQARTVSRPGVISADELPPEAMVPYIQSDAGLLPAMGGGPLVNQRSGRVLGINTLQYAPQGRPRLTITTPLAAWLALLPDLREHGRLRRTGIGTSVQNLTAERAAALGLAPRAGVLVTQLLPGGAAQAAGLRVGDVVLSIDGQATNSAAAYFLGVDRHKPGETLKLQVLRGGRLVELLVTAAEAPPAPVH